TVDECPAGMSRRVRLPDRRSRVRPTPPGGAQPPRLSPATAVGALETVEDQVKPELVLAAVVAAGLDVRRPRAGATELGGDLRRRSGLPRRPAALGAGG